MTGFPDSLLFPRLGPPRLRPDELLSASVVQQTFRARVVGGDWTQEYTLTASSKLPFRNSTYQAMFVEVEYINRWFYGSVVIKETREIRSSTLQPLPLPTGTVDMTIYLGPLYHDPWGGYWDEATNQWLETGPVSYFYVYYTNLTVSGAAIPSATPPNLTVGGAFLSGLTDARYLEADGTDAVVMEVSSPRLLRGISLSDSTQPQWAYGDLNPVSISNPGSPGHTYSSGPYFLPMRDTSTDPEPGVGYDLTLELQLYCAQGLGYPAVTTKTVTTTGFWTATPGY